MKIKGNVVVLTNGKLNTKSAKTAHGLIRGSKRFKVVAVIDSSLSEKYIHLDKNGKIDLLDKKSDIPIFNDACGQDKIQGQWDRREIKIFKSLARFMEG